MVQESAIMAYAAARFAQEYFLQDCSEEDSNWPEPDRVGKQELEIVIGGEHISFSVRFP